MNRPRSWSYYSPSYARIIRTFRNGVSIVRAHHKRADCSRAVLWNGRSIENVAKDSGIVSTVVEIWGAQSYTTSGFWKPGNDDVILDLGANVGIFARWVLHCAPGARVTALEPYPANFSILQRNVADFAERVTVHECAVGARSERSTMTTAGTSISHTLGGAQNGPAVSVITLADAIGLTRSAEIDFLKMDIEGSERDIFEDSVPEDLMRRIKHLAIEYHDNLRPGTFDLLRARLAPTHQEISIDDSGQGYGLIRASRRSAR
jgi:FkbM family methyltransferase